MRINEHFLQGISEIFSAIAWHKAKSTFRYCRKTQHINFNLKATGGYDKAMTPAYPTVTTLTRLECVIGSVTHMTMNLGHPIEREITELGTPLVRMSEKKIISL